MKKILKRATACLLAVLMLAGEATVQVAAIDSKEMVRQRQFPMWRHIIIPSIILIWKGMCYIMRDKGY